MLVVSLPFFPPLLTLAICSHTLGSGLHQSHGDAMNRGEPALSLYEEELASPYVALVCYVTYVDI